MFGRLVRVALAGALASAFLAVALSEDSPAAVGTQVSVGDSAVWEGDGGAYRTMQFAVTLSQPATSEVTVTATIAPGTATHGTDYRTGYSVTKTVKFRLGQTYKPVAVAVVPDVASEGDETLTVTLSNPTPGIDLGRATATGTIRDDDPGTGVRMSVGDASVVEGDSGIHKMTLWVTLSQPAGSDVTATAMVSGGTATAGTDFKAFTKNLLFRLGQVKKPVVVPVYSDVVGEADETVMVMLSNVSANATPADSMGTGTILDDDGGAPEVLTATFRLGPFSLAPEGSPGSESNSTQANIPKPSGAFGVVGMRFDVVHGDGTSEGHHNVHLHHVVFMDSSRPDSLCPSLPNRFAGSGQERTPATFGTEYAYKVGAADQWNALWHIMNTSTATHTVYIEYEVDYVVGDDLAAAKPLTSYFYDVDNCWGDSEFNVPGNGGPGSIFTKSIGYTAPRSGVRVFTGGHLHDGGIDLILTQNGTEVCRPTAMYMDGMLHHISSCNTPVNVTAGNAIQLTARYSNEVPIAGAMGISVSYVWEP
jgi:hypothetical protein